MHVAVRLKVLLVDIRVVYFLWDNVEAGVREGNRFTFAPWSTQMAKLLDI